MSKGRVIGLISGKGGVGKTSMCVNIGVGLKQLGQEVTVVDADFSASNLGVHLGRYDHPVKIQDVLHEEAEPSSAIFRHPTGLKAITASNEIHEVEPDTRLLRDVLEAAAQESDYVLVDCPPGLNTTVEAVMDACDELVIVTMPTQTAGINAAQIIEKAKQRHQAVLGTIVNKMDNNPETELVEREVEIMTESDIIAQVPYDKKMKESLFHNTPLLVYDPISPAAMEIRKLSYALEGQTYDEPRFAALKRKLRRLKEKIKR